MLFVLIYVLISLFQFPFLINIGKEMSLPGFRRKPAASLFPVFLQAPVNIFTNQAQNGSKGHYCYFVTQPYNPTKVFLSTVG